MKLTDREIRATIDKLKSGMVEFPKYSGVWLPISRRVLNRKRYNGYGRPKNEDYDFIAIDWGKELLTPKE